MDNKKDSASRLKKLLNTIIVFEGYVSFFIGLSVFCVIGAIFIPIILDSNDFIFVLILISFLVAVILLCTWVVYKLIPLISEAYHEILGRNIRKEE